MTAIIESTNQNRTIDLGEHRSFTFKHPYFLLEWKVKFEGWKPDLQKEFESIISKMGGQVSDEALIIFTDSVYFSSINGKADSGCYYSLRFFKESIEAEEPLDISLYKFVDLVATGELLGLVCCCDDIQAILKANTDSNQNVNIRFCTLCEREKMSQNLLHKDVLERHIDSCDSDDSIIILDSHGLKDGGTFGLKRKQPLYSTDLGIKSGTSNGKQKSSIERWKRKKTDDPKIAQLNKGFSGKLMKDIENWWYHLPVSKPDPDYKEKDPVPFKERDYTDQEERIIIAYLIKNNLIDAYDKRSTWRKMHQDGYLRPRSIDSLKSHVKVVMSCIRQFQLPEYIEQKFLSLLEKVNTR